MKFTLLHLTSTERYWPAPEDEYDSLGILLYFLNFDVRDESGAVSFTDWAISTKWQHTSSNVSSLEKINGNIIIKDLFTEESDEQPFCEIKLQNFVELLDKWAEMAKKKPPYMVFVDKGDGDVSLEDL